MTPNTRAWCGMMIALLTINAGFWLGTLGILGELGMSVFMALGICYGGKMIWTAICEIGKQNHE